MPALSSVLFPCCSFYIFIWQVIHIIIRHVQMTVRDALNSALDEEMSADPSVFLMGEEVLPGKILWAVLFFPLFSGFFIIHIHIHLCRLESIKVHTRFVKLLKINVFSFICH